MKKPKLNPPTTAPMDGTMILGHFGYPWLIPAIWNGADEEWCLAIMQMNMVAGNWNDAYFETERETSDKLEGWFPIPPIPKP